MTHTRRLMAVHAHPDDESSKGAATTARYAAEGHEVLVVSCTGGERGDILNPAFGTEPKTLDEMKQIRRTEMANAANALGVSQHWLGFVDSGLPEGDPLPPLPRGSFAAGNMRDEIAALVAVVRQFRPHVMTTYDPMGGYPHPDHVRAHQVALGAFLAAGDPAAFPDAGPPWSVLKLYYNHDFSLARSMTLHEALREASHPSPFGEWIERREQWDIVERPVTTRIDVADYQSQRDTALLAHASQIDPEGFFFAVPREIERDVWPWEEYELAASRVPTHLPETDLFAGIDPHAADTELQSRLTESAHVAGYEDLVPGDLLADLIQGRTHAQSPWGIEGSSSHDDAEMEE